MNAPPRKAKPRPYHHGHLKQALLEAAMTVVERQGLAALSLRAVAEEVGVSHAAHKHHFADKAQLIAELAAEGFRQLSEVLLAAEQAQAGATGKLEAVGRAYLDFALRRPGAFRVMFARELSDLPELPAELVAQSTGAFSVLLRVTGGASVQPSMPTLTAWALVHGLAVLWLDGPVRYAVPGARPGAPLPAAAARFLEVAHQSLAQVARMLTAAPG